MATESTRVGQFLRFLSNPETSIPKGAQWIVSFDEGSEKSLDNLIFKAIQLAYDGEPNAFWKTLDSAKKIMKEEYQKTACLFCQAIALPGETIVSNVEGKIPHNGFIGSYVGGGRENFPIMRMTFIDTHVSFVDTVLRGWALATAKFGMIARPRDDEKNYRANLVCHKFGISPNGPSIIQTVKFFDLCCVGVSEEEYNYLPVTQPIMREARFVYNSYSLETFDPTNDFK